jgi:hypothetical protein
MSSNSKGMDFKGKPSELVEGHELTGMCFGDAYFTGQCTHGLYSKWCWECCEMISVGVKKPRESGFGEDDDEKVTHGAWESGPWGRCRGL